ncbi:MAG: hypothetical protein COS76_03995 [Candidatus Portnoybacteria bacterium CG06_land_8_20_14_3_00_39_12]|uniref:Uncharacterized protein n=2 Tax=Candidatus Portnoyibacteriota TaxID=1817913 RepID=A0A2M8KFB2_9BACT|nr:MAG: hypothetical protein AUJ33_02385 [Parcubacteria group bacterium CG1_02_40_25]PIU74840.1 MAG: hypothetical protein COS76_03995 [Candidatus Portnoybacteria bacterium CG06_land_8_20_14_3_00_39_12]PJE58626.1 MAG: hypothetical protein COU83_02855 [Candidatus Portnoybacteria bacterium CG10_big_fil_rev_8_21_14_0_10_40_22]
MSTTSIIIIGAVLVVALVVILIMMKRKKSSAVPVVTQEAPQAMPMAEAVPQTPESVTSEPAVSESSDQDL